MMPALHQNLHSACGSEFIQLFIELLETKHVMIFVALRSIKRAELAVNITDVRVIDVAIDDVRHDLASTAAVTCRFCQITRSEERRVGKECRSRWSAEQCEEKVLDGAM